MVHDEATLIVVTPFDDALVRRNRKHVFCLVRRTASQLVTALTQLKIVF